MQTTITIKGTHCNACKVLIEDVCKEVAGVQSCLVDFATGKTEIMHDNIIDWQTLKKEIEKLGDYNVDL